MHPLFAWAHGHGPDDYTFQFARQGALLSDGARILTSIVDDLDVAAIALYTLPAHD